MSAAPADRIRPLRAHEHVAEEIRRRITLRLVRSGESLPSDRDLAEELGVGRATVQAAIRLLEAERLVVTKRGRHGGTFVLSLADDDLARDYLLARLRNRGDAIAQALTFREIVEPRAAGLAATARTGAELAAIEAAAEVFAAAGEGAAVADGLVAQVDVEGAGPDDDAVTREDAAFTARDNAFHLAIASASHNTFVHEAVVQVRLVLNDALLARPASPVWQERTDLEHAAILAAIRAQDAPAAAAAMATHCAWTAENVRAILAEL